MAVIFIQLLNGLKNYLRMKTHAMIKWDDGLITWKSIIPSQKL